MEFLKMNDRVVSISNNELYNRIKKNFKKIKKIATKEKTNCFRVYDKDIPSFPLTIDYYNGRFCINYYWTKRSTEKEQEYHQDITVATLQELFDLSSNQIIQKNRKTRDEKEQFEKLDDADVNFIAMENGLNFKINLNDYIDTGLFLDHKPARKLAASQCKNKKVLNLFAYTASFSVYVLKLGEAKFCRSVDISNTYLEWGKINHEINNIESSRYELRRDDCIEHLKYAVKKKEIFDFIIMDPPTLSRAKKMKKSFFQIQKDHPELIHNAMKVLAPDGTLLFSNNLTSFKMDEEIIESYIIQDITTNTIPEGFRNKKIHKTFLINHKFD